MTLEMLVAKYGKKAKFYDIILSEFKMKKVRCVKRGSK